MADLFDIVVARKLSGGGGGGGSSDFSTATVTLINPLSDFAPTVDIPCAYNDEYMTSAVPSALAESNSSAEVPVILYQGRAEAAFFTSQIEDGFYFASATGGVEIDAEFNFMAHITGDGTLTIGKN